MASWMQLLVSGVAKGSIYALIALGFVTIYRSSRIVNMAQGSFVMFGALFVFSMFMEVGLPYWLSAIIGTVMVVILGVLMYQYVLKWALKVSLVTMILCTVALSLLFENLALLKYGGYTKNLPDFAGNAPVYGFIAGGVNVRWQALFMIGLMIVVLIILWFLNNRTLVGKQMQATATNPMAASLSGINVSRMILLSFVISSAIGALGGLTMASYVGGLNYMAGGSLGMLGFVAAVLGGWGSSAGAVIGGLALGIVQSLSLKFVPAGYANVVAFIILLIVLYFRPQGLLGTDIPEGEAR